MKLEDNLQGLTRHFYNLHMSLLKIKSQELHLGSIIYALEFVASLNTCAHSEVFTAL